MDVLILNRYYYYYYYYYYYECNLKIPCLGLMVQCCKLSGEEKNCLK